MLRMVFAASLVGLAAGAPHVMTVVDQIAILNVHNTVRVDRGACLVEWDTALAAAAEASDTIQQCASSSIGNSANAGDTLFMGSRNVADIAQIWADTRVHFIGTFSHEARPFIRMAWKNTAKVGCAACFQQLPFGQFTHLVCHYDGAGSVSNNADIAANVAAAGTVNCCSRADGFSCGSNGETCQGGTCQAQTCQPVSATYNGKPLARTPLLVSDLVWNHKVPIGTGHLSGFSTVVAAGAVDGEVLTLQNSMLSASKSLTFECPAGCSDECEIYVLAYHCPVCSGSVSGGLILAAQDAGWELSSCAPSLEAGGPAVPMVALRKVMAPGTVAHFPRHAANHVAVLAFRRELVDCPTLDASACAATNGCLMHREKCVTEAWCPRRFRTGPFPPNTAPGCATNCLA